MLNTSSLDTNILVRLITNDNKRQSALARKLLTSETDHFVIDDVAIMETVHVLESCYNQSREEIVDNLKAVFSCGSVVYTFEAVEEVFPLYLSHPKLSFNDIYLSVKSEQKSAEPLWTFDKKLASQLQSPKMLV